MLIVVPITEFVFNGRSIGLQGTILHEPDDPVAPSMLWAFWGRQVLEAIRMRDRVFVPLQMYHVDQLYRLGLIDLLTARRIAVIAVR